MLRLVAEGWNDCQISRATGIPRSTVLGWRHGRLPRIAGHRWGGCPRCDGAVLDEPAYVYLLGLYLGDGCIVQLRRCYRLGISQDARYPHLIALARQTIDRVRDGAGRVGIVDKGTWVDICGHWQHWPCLFPQHGPGLKHHRPIQLAEWQTELVDRYPRQLLRGLIHSDGCRVMNRVWKGKYAYPRYFFTNSSADIRQIFRNACDAIGVAHRSSRPNVISVARREAVAAFDAFIGPKV